MKSPMIQWFFKPYPLNFTIISRIITSLSFGFFVTFYTYIFTPFDFEGYANLFYASFSFGVITTLVALFFTFVIPPFIPSFFDSEKWTTGKMSFFIFLITLTVGFCSYWYNLNLKLHEGHQYISLPYFLFYTLLIGIFPILIYVVIYEYYSRKMKQKIANNISKNIEKQPYNIDRHTIKIKEGSKKDIEINIKDLIYVRAQGNYVSFYIKVNTNLIEKVARTSFSKVETLLKNESSSFVKCHRSYIINSNYFNRIIGNARSYSLKSPKTEVLIPVSRSYPKEELKKLISLQ